MAENQRRSPRVPIDVRVNYDFNAIAHSKDISDGGICLITEQPLAEGKMIALVFQLPGVAQPIESVGKVMWSRKATEHLHESGVSFWDIKEKEHFEIKRFLANEELRTEPPAQQRWRDSACFPRMGI